MVNGQIKNLVNRVGAEDAPRLVKFYLSLNDPFYVRTLHPVGPMLKDCETLMTRMRTGVQITERSRAQQVSAHNQSQLERIKKGEL